VNSQTAVVVETADDTGPVGPVAVSAMLFLIGALR
jgi:hypothetical protein